MNKQLSHVPCPVTMLIHWDENATSAEKNRCQLKNRSFKRAVQLFDFSFFLLRLHELHERLTLKRNTNESSKRRIRHETNSKRYLLELNNKQWNLFFCVFVSLASLLWAQRIRKVKKKSGLVGTYKTVRFMVSNETEMLRAFPLNIKNSYARTHKSRSLFILSHCLQPSNRALSCVKPRKSRHARNSRDLFQLHVK